ncbi:MAG: hypothetical protein ACRC5C_13260 [Bacilli bacterium]
MRTKQEKSESEKSVCVSREKKAYHEKPLAYHAMEKRIAKDQLRTIYRDLRTTETELRTTREKSVSRKAVCVPSKKKAYREKPLAYHAMEKRTSKEHLRTMRERYNGHLYMLVGTAPSSVQIKKRVPQQLHSLQ